jgi:uncharacterized membrane protein
MAPAITGYGLVKALHVISVLAAFGLPLSYPMLMPYVRRAHPRAMPALHQAQHRMLQRLIAPGTVLVLAFGAYLATDGGHWDEVWVMVPLAIVVVIGAVGGAYLSPRSAEAAELAGDSVRATPDGGAVAWSADYDVLYRRVMAAEGFLGALVLLAIFFMTARPFA